MILDTGAWVLLYEIDMYKRVQLLGSCYMNMYDTYWYYKRVLLYISIGIIHLHITRPKQLWSWTVCYTLACDRTFILFTRCILVLVTFELFPVFINPMLHNMLGCHVSQNFLVRVNVFWLSKFYNYQNDILNNYICVYIWLKKNQTKWNY